MKHPCFKDPKLNQHHSKLKFYSLRCLPIIAGEKAD